MAKPEGSEKKVSRLLKEVRADTPMRRMLRGALVGVERHNSNPASVRAAQQKFLFGSIAQSQYIIQNPMGLARKRSQPSQSSSHKPFIFHSKYSRYPPYHFFQPHFNPLLLPPNPPPQFYMQTPPPVSFQNPPPQSSHHSRHRKRRRRRMQPQHPNTTNQSIAAKST